MWMIITAVVVVLFFSGLLGGLGATGKLKFTEAVDENTTYIFYAPWCGHCKAAMPEFERAVEQGQGRVVLINSDLPESQPLIELYGVKGFPTIMKGDNVFDGPRTAQAILDFTF
jgi:thiol-disulfide isomerase/thioredoxin